MFNKPESKPNFFMLEQAILSWWKENQILEKSIDQRPEEQYKTFFDGPITANGEPHTGHMLTFAMKDIIPRYWTMKGFRVTRSLGWDCQGIPVEYEVEKKLGFKEKKDIVKYGIEAFNKLCRESVLEYKDKIEELEELMGRLTNKEEEYFTMDSKYIESIWWSLKELFDKGLLYEGFKVVPYSTRAGTTLSNAEVALGGYKNFVDPAITVEFTLKDDPTLMLLAWTTTPWTMPGNLGLAIGKDIEYIKVKGNDPVHTYIVAKDAVENVFKGDPYTIVGEIKAEELVGQEYNPPFDFYKGRENAHKIYYGDHVTADSGTGIVHLAPYGAEDNDIFQSVGIKSFDYLDDQGDFTQDVPPYAGQNYRVANERIIDDLNRMNRLFRKENYEHEMPMCWRTNTPLIYKPITSWYIAMSSLRSELVTNNEKINWTPSHVKQGRFGNWLAEIKDWGISRLRYWGTPLPIWKSESGKLKFIGSFEELERLSGIKLTDPHRPFVDEVTFILDGETYKRIPDVLDVWYDSGAMPFARFHYPFENKEKFEKKFPAQYIAESVDQTRGWFYSLLAVSTALFNKESFQNVVMSGFTLDDKGVKQSKSKKNYTDPKPTVEKYGADTIRFNFFATPISAGEDTTISESTLKIHAQEYMLPIWNIYSYLATYANIHGWIPTNNLVKNTRVNDNGIDWDHIPWTDLDNELDAWIVLRLEETIKTVTESLDSYQIPKATRTIKDLIEDTSKWYIRRSRDRFAEGDKMALEVLYYVFIETLKLLAPFAPFITEHLYKELVVQHIDEEKESVHLTDYPVADQKFLDQYTDLKSEMEFVRKICDLGQTLRSENGLKVRQPLALLEVINQNTNVPMVTEWMQEMIKSELNVKEVVDTPTFTESETALATEDTSIKVKISLETKLTDELMSEGIVRELTRHIQALRKNSGFEQGEKVNVTMQIDDQNLNEIISKNIAALSASVSAQNITLAQITAEDVKEVTVNDSIVKIKVEKL
mgnify:CR=1 FL=1